MPYGMHLEGLFPACICQWKTTLVRRPERAVQRKSDASFLRAAF